jgi:hypothetical protein
MARTPNPEVLASFRVAPVFSALPPVRAGRARAAHPRGAAAGPGAALERRGQGHRPGVGAPGPRRGGARLAPEGDGGRRRRQRAGGGGSPSPWARPTSSTCAACARRAWPWCPPSRCRRCLRAQPNVAVALTFELAQEVLRLTRRLEALSAGSVSQRMARVLLGLTERFGEPFPGGTLMPVRLRREDLAALAATTLESASPTDQRVEAPGRAGPPALRFPDQGSPQAARAGRHRRPLSDEAACLFCRRQ